uniref:Uncharacterized protein n=1 Tax=Noctiluca scintillans TaxID=2966 RepID=A0A7S1FBT6_NOCSC|mmetsp:Transcript_5148/g.14429  ORF Transcript_5148/g.14429 Transcript_5148/m.14429 type:complete len:271 (+) Transcript_5148:82-894(+)|eukprot:CAMPEP_0194479298 /NCGR_PEP_ID=MMETSP0253-20130528/2467_1 /TAXON_ID=2966 /ORGANISM="Noctiluca scintillans" /LENGTH=270 /DNA_ID=CAMNT_0039318509 /DNA_START=74 /DNA_END=886 /DNA_ORIENTATION=+
MENQGLSQGLLMLASVANGFTVVMPAPRPPDAVTLSHQRAAEEVYRLAGWTFSGVDLRALIRKTPYLVEDKEGLWQYYCSMNPAVPIERAFLLIIAAEVANYNDRPILRRVLYGYAAFLGAIYMAPCHIFYTLHRIVWNHQWVLAVREVGTPMPPPASCLMVRSVQGLLEGAKVTPGSTALATGRGDAGSWWKRFLPLAVMGVGLAVWFIQKGSWASPQLAQRSQPPQRPEPPQNSQESYETQQPRTPQHAQFVYQDPSYGPDSPYGRQW